MKKAKAKKTSEKIIVKKTSKSPRKKAKLVVKRARPIHHRIVLHPISIFTLLCVGVFIVSWTYRANADSYVVTAKVAAPALVDAATIDSPRDGAVYGTNTITVSGQCPANSYLVLYRNAAMSGVATCSVTGTYDIQTSLYPGTNILKVQDYNLTDDPGPTTPVITVTYNPPISPVINVPSGNPNTSPTQNTTYVNYPDGQLPVPEDIPLITATFTYQTFEPGAQFEWKLDVNGGTAPYNLLTNWGDDTTSVQTVDKPSLVRISHVYKKSGHYNIIVKITDAKGSVSILQLVAIIKVPGSLVFNGSLPHDEGKGSFLTSGAGLIARHWLAIVWSSYATVTLMAISFWLGERQKVAELLRSRQLERGRPRSHRHHPA